MKVFDLEIFDTHYYIKRESIVAKIPFGNRTLYSKYQRIDTPLTQHLIQKHQNYRETVAIPLLHNARTNYLLMEYTGERHQHFYHLVTHLLSMLHIADYQIYQGRDEEHLQLFVAVDNLPLLDAEAQLLAISNTLEQKLTKQWRCLPSSQLPDEYNIAELPYKRLSTHQS